MNDNETADETPASHGYIDERTWRTVTGRPQNPTVPYKTKTPREIQDELEATAEERAERQKAARERLEATKARMVVTDVPLNERLQDLDKRRHRD